MATSQLGPQVGDKAPAFDLPADGGEHITLMDFNGKPLVLYFYPKDDTAGCTKEAIGFTEAASDFEKLDVTVLGLSKDSVATHDKFIKKHGLNVRLLSDENGAVCESYGVWVEKNMYGRKYMGIERATYLIDGKGIIRNVWRKVKVTGHVAAVLEAARAL